MIFARVIWLPGSGVAVRIAGLVAITPANRFATQGLRRAKRVVQHQVAAQAVAVKELRPAGVALRGFIQQAADVVHQGIV